MKHFDKTYRELLDAAREQNSGLKFVILEPFFLPVGKYIEHYHDFMNVFVRKQAIILKSRILYSLVTFFEDTRVVLHFCMR